PLQYGLSQNVLDGIGAGLGVFGVPSPHVFTDPEDRNMTVTPALPGLPVFGPGLPAQPATNARAYGLATHEWGVSGQLDWDFGGYTLTSLAAHRDWDATRDQDIDFSSIDIAYRGGLNVGFKTFTQEFRLQGEVGRLNWLAGLFYGNERLDTTDTIRIGAH